MNEQIDGRKEERGRIWRIGLTVSEGVLVSAGRGGERDRERARY
jgi:hypothetical protein